MRGVDIFSRKIVGWEGHECESADLAATLIRQAVMAEGCLARPLVLHADNGSPPFLRNSRCAGNGCQRKTEVLGTPFKV